MRSIKSCPPTYGVTADQCDELARAVAFFGTLIVDAPPIYRHPYDQDDSDYVNLPVHALANLIVSRDRHLLMLADASRSEGREFQTRFPTIRIIDPVEFLRDVELPNA